MKENEAALLIKETIGIGTDVTVLQTTNVVSTKLIHFKTEDGMKGTAYSHDNGNTYKVFYDGSISDMLGGVDIKKIKRKDKEEVTHVDVSSDDENNVILEKDGNKVLVPVNKPVSSYNKGTLRMILKGIVARHPGHRIINANVPEDLIEMFAPADEQ